MTDRCYACILEYNDGKIITRAYGDMKDKNFQTSSLGVHAAIDPGTYPSYCRPFQSGSYYLHICLESRIVALRLFDGIIKIINLNSSNKQLTATTQRIDEIEVLDMQFLYVVSKPTLALLYQDQSVSTVCVRNTLI